MGVSTQDLLCVEFRQKKKMKSRFQKALILSTYSFLFLSLVHRRKIVRKLDKSYNTK